MKELRVDIGGSVRGFEAAAAQAKRIGHALQGALGRDITSEMTGNMAALKVLINEVSQSSRVAGLALQLAYNPVVGVIRFATAMLDDFRNAQKIAAEEAKKAAKDTQDAWMGAQEAIYSKDPTRAFAARTAGEAKSGVRTGFDVGDETELGWFQKSFPFIGSIQAGASWVSDKSGLTGLLGGKTQAEQLEEAQVMREAAARGTASGALRRTRNAEQKEEAKKAAEARAKEQAQLQRQLRDEMERTAPLQDRIQLLSEDVSGLENIRARAELTGNENAKLAAQIDLLRKKQELEGAQKELARQAKPTALGRKGMTHIDSLSSMGLISSTGALTNPVLDVSRRQLAKLDDIYNVLKGRKDIYAP